MLHSSGLEPEYWSFALTHAVYLKNRLPHTATYTGNQPSTSQLHIFGCPVIVKNPGKRPIKLDLNTSTERFLCFTATERNVYYMDCNTHHLKIAAHCIFWRSRHDPTSSQTYPGHDSSSTSWILQDARRRPSPAGKQEPTD